MARVGHATWDVTRDDSQTSVDPPNMRTSSGPLPKQSSPQRIGRGASDTFSSVSVATSTRTPLESMRTLEVSRRPPSTSDSVPDDPQDVTAAATAVARVATAQRVLLILGLTAAARESFPSSMRTRRAARALRAAHDVESKLGPTVDLVILHAQVVCAAGQRRYIHNRFVRRPVVDGELPVEPDAYAVIADRSQRVRADRQRDTARRDDGELGLRHSLHSG